MIDTTIQDQLSQPEEKDSNIRVALLVEYCGQNFKGSQYQPEQPTVQAAMQEALGQLGLKTSAVTFASRTDSGVHALGQVAHFDVREEALSRIPKLACALNAVLPEAVSVRAVHENIGRHFHSRRDAAAKWYRYKIYNSISRSVWAQKTGATLYRPQLDANLMSQAASLITGEHDFKSFKDVDTDVVNDVCHIYHCKVSQDGEFIILDIAANRFLYKMIRNIVGQLMTIGKVSKPLPPDTILKVLAERDRRKASHAAPAEGLTLMAVQHKAPFNLFESDVYVQQFKNILKPMESLQNENLFRKAS